MKIVSVCQNGGVVIVCIVCVAKGSESLPRKERFFGLVLRFESKIFRHQVSFPVPAVDGFVEIQHVRVTKVERQSTVPGVIEGTHGNPHHHFYPVEGVYGVKYGGSHVRICRLNLSEQVFQILKAFNSRVPQFFHNILAKDESGAFLQDARIFLIDGIGGKIYANGIIMTVGSPVQKLVHRVDREVYVRELIVKLVQRVTDVAVCHALLVTTAHKIRQIAGGNHQLQLIAVYRAGSVYRNVSQFRECFGDSALPFVVSPPGFIYKKCKCRTFSSGLFPGRFLCLTLCSGRRRAWAGRFSSGGLAGGKGYGCQNGCQKHSGPFFCFSHILLLFCCHLGKYRFLWRRRSRVYSFTDPSIIPCTKYFCRKG